MNERFQGALRFGEHADGPRDSAGNGQSAVGNFDWPKMLEQDLCQSRLELLLHDAKAGCFGGELPCIFPQLLSFPLTSVL